MHDLLVRPDSMRLSPLIRRSLVRLAICAMALAVPSAALADCGHEIIDQAYKGKITKHFSQACYNQAIRIEPVDGSSYSDIDSIIRCQARRCAARARRLGRLDPERQQQRKARPAGQLAGHEVDDEGDHHDQTARHRRGGGRTHSCEARRWP